MPTDTGQTQTQSQPRSVQFAQLLSASAFAFAQPVFGVLGSSPEIFVTRDATRFDVVVFALVAVIGPALLAWFVVGLVGLRWQTAARRTHMGFVAAGVGLWFVQLLPDPTGLRVAGLYTVGLLSLVLLRSDPVRRFLAWGAVGAAAFVGSFLFVSPVSALVLQGSDVVTLDAVPDGVQAPVIFLIFDEFPLTSIVDGAGELNAARAPNLAALADHATWYRTAVPASPYTSTSIPTILSGSAPRFGGVPTATEYPSNLFTALGGAYAATNVIEPITDLCPAEVCSDGEPRSASARVPALLRLSWDIYVRRIVPERYVTVGGGAEDVFGEFVYADTFADRVDAAVATDQADRFRAFVGSIGTEPRTLNVGHFFLPHAPFHFLPDTRTYNGNRQVVEGLVDGVWTGDPWTTVIHHQRHLAQVGAVDELVGELVEHLEAINVFDDALIVITSDHGVSFQPGQPRRDLTEQNKYELGLVPLIVKAPRQQEGRVEAEPVQLTDVVNIVRDALGLALQAAPDRAAAGPSIGTPAASFVLDDPVGGLRREAERVIDAFGDGGDPSQLYAVGPRPDLLGTELTSVAVGAPTGASITLTEVGDLSSVDAAGRFIPSLLRGTVSGAGVRAGDAVAFVLNGTVAATVPAFSDDGVLHVSALLWPEAFRSRVNRLRSYVVEGQGQSTVFRPVTIEGLEVFEIDPQATRVVVGDGRAFDIDETSVLGFVDSAIDKDGVRVLGGWAVSRGSDRRAAEFVVAVRDGIVVGWTVPSLERAGLVEAYGEGSRTSGYSLTIAGGSAGGTLRDVEVYGLVGGRATRLGVVDGVLDE